MKTVCRWWKLILCSAILGLLASCATYTYMPTDSTVGSMSVMQARKALATGLKSSSSVIVNQGSLDYITDVRVNLNRLVVTGKKGQETIIVYSGLPQISIHREMEASNQYGTVLLAGKNTFKVGQPDDLIVMNALYVLQQNAIKQKKASDDYDANFAASLVDYRHKATSNAGLPEEANKYKVQAEGAVRDKEFNDAADYYGAALNVAPWWPAGHFNRALVLGEAGDYDMAKREMNYYLQLVPGASNARAAQDKIYDWVRLEAK
jgi:hypothetical protein